MKNVFLYSLSSLFFISLLNIAFIKPQTTNIPQKEGGASFAEFLSHFEKVETPFAIQLGDLSTYANKKPAPKKKASQKYIKGVAQEFDKTSKTMVHFIPELKHGLFSRSGPPEVLPIARFYPNDNMVAVVYMTYQEFWQKEFANYKLALFDLRGRELPLADAEEKISYQRSFHLGQARYSKTQTFSIDEEGYICRNEYENLWKSPVQEVGFKNNEIIGYELKESTFFNITSAGQVEALKEYPIDSRASLD